MDAKTVGTKESWQYHSRQNQWRK